MDKKLAFQILNILETKDEEKIRQAYLFLLKGTNPEDFKRLCGAYKFIENNVEDAERQKGLSEGRRKQDCETKAFKRLVAKIKKVFPGLPIILLTDSLYTSEPVMGICRDNGWEFIIRYKTGSIPGTTEEYEKIPGKGMSVSAEFINGINYKGKPVDMLRFLEEKIVSGEAARTDFQWLTSIRITKKNAEKIAGAGR